MIRDLGNHYPSERALEVNLFVHMTNLQDKWWEKPIPPVQAVSYEVKQAMRFSKNLSWLMSLKWYCKMEKCLATFTQNFFHSQNWKMSQGKNLRESKNDKLKRRSTGKLSLKYLPLAWVAVLLTSLTFKITKVLGINLDAIKDALGISSTWTFALPIYDTFQLITVLFLLYLLRKKGFFQKDWI